MGKRFSFALKILQSLHEVVTLDIGNFGMKPQRVRHLLKFSGKRSWIEAPCIGNNPDTLVKTFPHDNFHLF